MPVKEKRKRIEFQPWMVQALKDHIKEGWSVSCFAGRYNINPSNWLDLLSNNQQLNEIRDNYNSMKVKSFPFFKYDA